MRSICQRRISQLGLDSFPLRPSILRWQHSQIAEPKIHNKAPTRLFSNNRPLYTGPSAASPEKTFQKRVQDVNNTYPEPYPRLEASERPVPYTQFYERFDYLEMEDTSEDPVVVHGRIRTLRTAGSKLIFFDIVDTADKLQVICNQRFLFYQCGVSAETFDEFVRHLHRGDIFRITGKAHRTRRGELAIIATEIPKILAPCLHNVPLDVDKLEESPYERHVQLLAGTKAKYLVRCRSHIIQFMRQYLLDRQFLEVDTPILSSHSGGAIAKPFLTSATEFPERQLSLRIAPELWLKRMVVGGLEKVFEIGPSFRNEGLDKTHNPEFTTCEFYEAHANLEDLLSMTEDFMSGLKEFLSQYHPIIRHNKAMLMDFQRPFRRIDFIPDLEKAIGRSLPDLLGSNATSEMLKIYEYLSLSVPANPTLPRLLDKLSAEYLEPQCQNPTYIINPPECLSPLSKTFAHPSCDQRVAARGELFIGGKEMANMYEEENSPTEQRHKFQEQLKYRDQGDPSSIDESYIQALEWGLPPTGGWGCGIDRLCMLFTDSQRIGDVLSFGNLRNVARPQASHETSSSES